MMDETTNDGWFRKRIKQKEGFRLTAYRCPRGVWTIGWGCTVKWPAAIEALNQGASLTITPVMAELLLTWEIAAAAGDYNRMFRGLTIDPVRRDALTEMLYTMGAERMSGFVRMIPAVRRGDWDTAAREALDSNWARRDVGPQRSQEVAHMLRTGERVDLL